MTERDDPERVEYEEALSAINCPYYRGTGNCATGCSQEPSCHVDTPTEGWEAVIDRYEATHPEAARARKNEDRDQVLRDQGWEYNQERGGFQRVPKP